MKLSRDRHCQTPKMTKTLNTSTLKLVQIIHVDFGHITQVIWTTFLMLVLSFDSIYSALIHVTLWKIAG